MYKDEIRALLSPAEHKVFQKLDTPDKIQTYLNKLKQNFSHHRDHILRSPRRVMREGKAYCIEAAIFAAAALSYHGREAYIMDMQAITGDVDHVVALFREGEYWGAISKTNYSVLKWRDPIYKSVRELAMSYFHEYFLDNGTKSFKAYSAPFDLAKFAPERWVVAEEPLEWLAVALDDSRHFPTAPASILKNKTRRASNAELDASDVREWKGEKRVLYSWQKKRLKRKKQTPKLP